MHRRSFLTLLGTAAAAWPLAARAQQRSVPVIGYLTAATNYAENLQSLREGLSEMGFIEDRNVVIEVRSAEQHNDRLPALAADLVRRQVTAIFTAGIPPTAAARAATSTIPIVFTGGFDPVAVGFVASLAHPGGNLTGATSLSIELAPKRLELLHELLPAARGMALLVDPANPISAETQSREFQQAARTLGLEPHLLSASSEGDFDAVFAAVAQRRVASLVIANTSLFNTRTAQLGALTLRHAVPAIFQSHEFVAAGGLMSYGDNGNVALAFRPAGQYLGRILKGEKPADLPVQQAGKIELIINMKTAKALGITFPVTLLGRADEVIE